ncbi:MAG: hypothetical protein KF782_14195 [Labilithrix sp.]|nr:hypothetical protein [Labilithrix sp.]
MRMLDVPPMPRVVPDGVFDAWSWCSSDVIEWRRPASAPSFEDATSRVEGQNPPGLVFVMRAECTFLPRELARLHAFGYGLDDELALAPWAIDDATDLLYERRARPRDVFWLAASTLDALLWGLHDWAHFHNHGPFDQPAMTELQCDLVALAWLRRNAGAVGLTERALVAVARGLAALSRQRFDDEGARAPVADLDALFLGPYPTTPL